MKSSLFPRTSHWSANRSLLSQVIAKAAGKPHGFGFKEDAENPAGMMEDVVDAVVVPVLSSAHLR